MDDIKQNHIDDLPFIFPDWPAPAAVKAFTTTRLGGVSATPYDTFNLSSYVGDNIENVHENRKRLMRLGQLPSEPIWLKQIHSTIVVDAEHIHPETQADASLASKPNIVCAVQTADCLPLLICTKKADQVAAIHAGWRGLANGIIEATIRQMCVSGEDLLVWLGPAIGPDAFTVGQEVRQQFVAQAAEAEEAFQEIEKNLWKGNLYLLAKQRLAKLNVTQVFGGDFCTFRETRRFFSFRRNNITGRMASVIWIQ